MASKSSSKPSKLLNSQENQLLIKLLGNRVQSLATAVVQFFIAFGDEWSLHVSLPLQSTIIITKFYAKKQFKNVYQMLSLCYIYFYMFEYSIDYRGCLYGKRFKSQELFYASI